ncbi:MAG: hypothetical protein WAK12_02090 [Acidimicrobiales bacterium]
MTKKNPSAFSTSRHARHHFGRTSRAPSLASPELPAPFIASSPLWVRLAARVLAPSLDARLAQGEGPETSPLLAARALRLTSWPQRRTIADSWLDVLIQAREKLSPFDPRVRLVNRRVLNVEWQIHALVNALLMPLTTARGVAMASTLLGDGAGPLYNPSSMDDLQMLLSEAQRELDPLARRSS